MKKVLWCFVYHVQTSMAVFLVLLHYDALRVLMKMKTEPMLKVKD